MYESLLSITKYIRCASLAMSSEFKKTKPRDAATSWKNKFSLHQGLQFNGQRVFQYWHLLQHKHNKRIAARHRDMMMIFYIFHRHTRKYGISESHKGTADVGKIFFTLIPTTVGIYDIFRTHTNECFSHCGSKLSAFFICYEKNQTFLLAMSRVK